MAVLFGVILFFSLVAILVLGIVFIIKWARKKRKLWIGLSNGFLYCRNDNIFDNWYGCRL